MTPPQLIAPERRALRVRHHHSESRQSSQKKYASGRTEWLTRNTFSGDIFFSALGPDEEDDLRDMRRFFPLKFGTRGVPSSPVPSELKAYSTHVGCTPSRGNGFRRRRVRWTSVAVELIIVHYGKIARPRRPLGQQCLSERSAIVVLSYTSMVPQVACRISPRAAWYTGHAVLKRLYPDSHFALGGCAEHKRAPHRMPNVKLVSNRYIFVVPPNVLRGVYNPYFCVVECNHANRATRS